jgi:hypothetical protein
MVYFDSRTSRVINKLSYTLEVSLCGLLFHSSFAQEIVIFPLRLSSSKMGCHGGGKNGESRSIVLIGG